MSGSGFNVGASPAPANTQFFGAIPDMLTLLVPGQGLGGGNGGSDNPKINGYTAARNLNQFTVYNTNMDGGSNVPTVTLTSGQSAPDGSTNANKFVESTSDSVHAIQAQAIVSGCVVGANFTSTVNPSAPLRIGVFAKAAGRTRFAIKVYPTNNDGAVSTVTVVYDLAGGQIGVAPFVGGGGSGPNLPPWLVGPLGASIVPWPDGWYLCYLDFVPGAVAGSNIAICSIHLDSGSGTAPISVTYTGDGVSGIIFWEAVMMPVLAWNMSGQVTYFNDFTNLNDIDVNGTYEPGFFWYPSRNPPRWTDRGYIIPQTFPSQITQAGSVLTLSELGGEFPWLQSCYPDGSGLPFPDGYGGTPFKLPLYFEASVSFNSSIFFNGHGIGGHWIQTLEQLTENGQPSSWVGFNEMDFSEVGDSGDVTVNQLCFDGGAFSANDDEGHTAGGSHGCCTYNGYPVWKSAIPYGPGYILWYNNVIYQSQISDNIGNQPDISPSDWQVYSLPSTINYTPFQIDYQNNFYTIGTLVLVDPVYGNINWLGYWFNGNPAQGAPGQTFTGPGRTNWGGAAVQDGMMAGTPHHYVLNLMGINLSSITYNVDFARVTQ